MNAVRVTFDYDKETDDKVLALAMADGHKNKSAAIRKILNHFFYSQTQEKSSLQKSGDESCK